MGKKSLAAAFGMSGGTGNCFVGGGGPGGVGYSAPIFHFFVVGGPGAPENGKNGAHPRIFVVAETNRDRGQKKLGGGLPSKPPV